MKTIYACEVCNQQFVKFDDCARDEGLCKMSVDIEQAVRDSGWTPPRPLSQFSGWTKADRHEMCRFVERFMQKG
jgi:hypothetical protein